MIVALAGGVGGAKLLMGLSRVLPVEEITVVGNTGDDIELLGLRICPDLDTIVYSLSGRVNVETGWGIREDTFASLNMLAGYGEHLWLKLGDKDLATHLWRTYLLRQGVPLGEVTRRISISLGCRCRVLPMNEGYTPTYVLTDHGTLHFQEYFVREQTRPVVRGFIYRDIDQTPAAPGVEKSILEAQIVIICPSNPFVSIAPILAVPGIKSALIETRAPVMAISPIVRGKALKGPAGKMLGELGHAITASSVAKLYQGVIDIFVLDEQDADLQEEIEAQGMKTVITNTVMRTLQDKEGLAQRLLLTI
ncbi:MAG: 2-phospho-L-lactate transferase [Acidobacteria bacterium]|nr:2-phospho-L-lactate transferase [Acidobacteriota bacterium]MCI0722500.1 2-phospho-L-lactate transferase [Acidobacteriota bacterium]